MLLMTRNTRSGGVGQGRASFSAPRSGAKRSLTDDGAEGIQPPMLMGCVFNTFTRSNRHVYATEPRTRRFAAKLLISFTFTHSNL